MTMNKLSIGASLKLPIEGIDYSNIETRLDWEFETQDDLENTLKQATKDNKLIREFVEKAGTEAEVKLRSKLEKLELNINKARESYLDIARENQELKAKLNKKENVQDRSNN